MKKISKIMLIVLLCMCFFIIGCSKKAENTTIEIKEETLSNSGKHWFCKKTNLSEKIIECQSKVKETLTDTLYTGHNVYKDAEGKLFIISADEIVYLEKVKDNEYKIPDKDLARVRDERDYRTIVTLKDKAEYDAKSQEYYSPKGNVRINDNATITVRQISVSNRIYWDVEKIGEETGMKVSKGKDAVELSYTGHNGETFVYSIPIEKKEGKTFMVTGKTGTYLCAFEDNEKMMVDSFILHDLMGMQVKLTPDTEKEPHRIITDEVDRPYFFIRENYIIKAEAPAPTPEIAPEEPRGVKPPIADTKPAQKPTKPNKPAPTPKEATGNGDVYDEETGTYPKLGEQRELPNPQGSSLYTWKMGPLGPEWVKVGSSGVSADFSGEDWSKDPGW